MTAVKRERNTGSGCRSRRRHGCAARFSLLELLVALALVAAVLALALPRVARLPRRLVIENATDRVRRVFREAALRARAAGHPVRLTVDTETRRFRIESVGTGAPAAAPGTTGFLMRRREFGFPEDTEWERPEPVGFETVPAFLFFPSGEAGGEPLEFLLRGARFRLTLDPLTGRLRIAETSGT